MKHVRHPITGCRVSTFVSEDVVWMIDPLLLEQVVSECKLKMQDPEFWQRASKEETDKDKEPPEPPYVLEDGVAKIGMSGPFTKYPTSFGTNSTVEKQKALRDARKDPQVKSIMMQIESGGGTANGTPELAEEVRLTDQVKPVYTFGDGHMASAAYYVGAASRRVFASRDARIGSIGTAAILYDHSKRYDAAGVKVVPIVTSEFKAAGATGAPITEEQQAEFQRQVNEINDNFISDVARYRSLPEQHLRDLKARVYLGNKALEHKLIDQVCTFEQAMEYAKNPPTTSVGGGNVTNVPAASGPAGSMIQPAASRSLAMQLSAEQLRVIREKVPGAAQITDDGMIAFLYEQTLRVPALEKNQAAPAVPAELLEERARFVQISIDALKTDGFATQAQADGLKKMIQKDCPLATAMLQRSSDGTYGFDHVVRVMRDSTPLITKKQGEVKPEEREVPGQKEADKVDGGAKTFQQAADKTADTVINRNYTTPWKKAGEVARN